MLVLVVVAVAGWRVLQVAHALTDADDDVSRLQSALRSDDRAAADRAQSDLATHVEAARSGTNGPVWSVLGVLPFVGDDADAVRTLSDSLVEVSDDVVTPLGRLSRDRDAFAPKDGTVPVERIEQIATPVQRAATALERVSQRLDAVDSSGLVGPLRTRWDDLTAKLDDVTGKARAAAAATQVLPSMLGADGPRSYLLVFQNNAESRATGGLPGSLALIRAVDGHIELVRQVPGAGFPEPAQPIVPLTKVEEEM